MPADRFAGLVTVAVFENSGRLRALTLKDRQCQRKVRICTLHQMFRLTPFPPGPGCAEQVHVRQRAHPIVKSLKKCFDSGGSDL